MLIFTVVHEVKRLQFAWDHANWIGKVWKLVQFTDKTWKCLKSSDIYNKILRKLCESYRISNFVLGWPFGGEFKIFWCCICLDASTTLILIYRRIWNAPYYLKHLLQDQVMSFVQFIVNHFHLMQDNAPQTLHYLQVTDANLLE